MCILFISVNSTILLSETLAAEENNDFERLEGLLCGAVKYLHGNRSKPEQTVFVTLMYLAKVKPNVFNSEIVIEVNCWKSQGFNVHLLDILGVANCYL